jgi:hypothetical protein
MVLAYATEHTPASHRDKLLLSIAIMRSEDRLRDRNSLVNFTAFSDTTTESAVYSLSSFTCKPSGGGVDYLL